MIQSFGKDGGAARGTGHTYKTADPESFLPVGLLQLPDERYVRITPFIFQIFRLFFREADGPLTRAAASRQDLSYEPAPRMRDEVDLGFGGKLADQLHGVLKRAFCQRLVLKGQHIIAIILLSDIVPQIGAHQLSKGARGGRVGAMNKYKDRCR